MLVLLKPKYGTTCTEIDRLADSVEVGGIAWQA